MSIPDKIIKLIETFDYNLETYKKGSYNETQVRLEFINPFFKELGWDITNKQGYAEAYKDVIHEDAIKIGGITKAPDYCFRIGGVRKFFLEAKKPAKTDKVSHSRIIYMKYTDYIERWDEITNIFSREEILIDRRRNQDC